MTESGDVTVTLYNCIYLDPEGNRKKILVVADQEDDANAYVKRRKDFHTMVVSAAKMGENIHIAVELEEDEETFELQYPEGTQPSVEHPEPHYEGT